MFLLYGVVQISPDFLNIMCHVSKNYFMNNLDYASAVKSRHCLTKECQEKRKGGGSCEGGRCGVETQCEVRLGGRQESHWTSISAKGNLHCPLYSEKEGLSGVATYLIGTCLKTKVFGVYCARLSSFHSEGSKPTDVVFLISHLQALIPISILTDQSSFIVLCHSYADRSDNW